ncbi:MAG: O-antigen ligase family protein, partial [Verrucomicrobiota bacterium]
MIVNAPTSSRPAPGEWIQTILLGGNLAWTTLCLGGYRPETMMVTAGLTCATLAVFFVTCGRQGWSWRRMDPAAWWLLAFLFYAAVNVAFVSPVKWLGWADWLGWANLIATFWVVLHGIRSALTRTLLWSVLVGLGLVGVAMACYQRFLQPEWLMLGRQQAAQFVGRAGGPFGIPNSFAGFLLLATPAAGVMAFRVQPTAVGRVWWAWVTLVFALGLVLTLSRGAWIGLALALLGGALGFGELTWKRRLRRAGLVVAAIALVAVVLYQTVPQARLRLDRLVDDSGERSRPILWRAAWQIFQEHPIVGSGAGSYAVRFERARPAGFIDQPQWAHNDYL